MPKDTSSSQSPKKMINMYILEVLKKYSDINHHLKQQDIIDKIKSEYDIDVERKAISVNISRLIEFGYDIVHENGYYLREREFDDSELRLLIDSVLFSKNIPVTQAKDLIEKLKGLSSSYFSLKLKHVASLNAMEHISNKQFFYNLELLDEAIDEGAQVKFTYNKYGEDMKLHPRKIHRTFFNPYQILASNGRYYVMGNVDKYDEVVYYRLDKITDIVKLKDTKVKPIESIKGLENGFNLPKHMAEHIYMFGGESQKVTFKIDRSRFDDVVDWFGTDFKIRESAEDYYIISVDVNVNAMYYWALQYGVYVEVLSPEDLRNNIRKTVGSIYRKYLHKLDNTNKLDDDDDDE
jgi:predicted DNA-binding transcriptional regulator YafY